MKYYHLRRIILEKTPHLAVVKSLVFFEKTQLFFRKKTRILNVLRIFTMPVAFYGKFATIWLKKITVRNVNEHRFSVNAIGKHRVKKRTHLRGRFHFDIINMAQNNNWHFVQDMWSELSEGISEWLFWLNSWNSLISHSTQTYKTRIWQHSLKNFLICNKRKHTI